MAVANKFLFEPS
jgi:hypothetical protein